MVASNGQCHRKFKLIVNTFNSITTHFLVVLTVNNCKFFCKPAPGHAFQLLLDKCIWLFAIALKTETCFLLLNNDRHL